jgi:hypothetical protein
MLAPTQDILRQTTGGVSLQQVDDGGVVLIQRNSQEMLLHPEGWQGRFIQIIQLCSNASVLDEQLHTEFRLVGSILLAKAIEHPRRGFHQQLAVGLE